MRWNHVWIAALAVLVVVALGGCSGGAGEPRVTNGMWIGDAGAGPYSLSPDGEQAVIVEGDSWCIADLPAPDGVDDVLPVTAEIMSPTTPELRCSDSPAVTSPFWSPDGSRIAALGQEPTPKLYVLDPSSLEIEAVLENAGWPAVWVTEDEILYFSAEQEPTWRVAPVDGDEPRSIPGPRPAPFVPVLVDDSRVLYRTDRPRTVANPGAADVADLIELDWKAGAAKELAALSNLNPEGQIADPGSVTDMTSDLRYAVLYAAGKANESGEGPTAYVYDLESDSLIAHTPPGLMSQTVGGRPFLVGDAWIVYSAWVSGETEPKLNVYIAPLDDPSAAIELFADGLLVDVQNDRLTIAPPSGGLAILDMGF